MNSDKSSVDVINTSRCSNIQCGALEPGKIFAVSLLTLALGFTNYSQAADLVVLDSTTVTGDEDTNIPLGINILESGAQLNSIGTATAFRDAPDVGTPAVFDIPARTTNIKITGLGGSDNASNSTT